MNDCFNWTLLGKDLRQWRTGIGVRGRADAMGVSPSTLSRAENGKPLSVDLLLTILAYHHVSIYVYARKP